MEIIDNFIDQEKFDDLQTLIMTNKYFPWYYRPLIDYQTDKDKFQFIHVFYEPPPSQFYANLNPIIERLDHLRAILSIKANLLIKTSNIIENAFHVDMTSWEEEKLKQWTTSIFYVNTNNGYTKFEDGTKVESVANRMVIFPANMKHLGTTCTDEKTRVVINFNYFQI